MKEEWSRKIAEWLGWQAPPFKHPIGKWTTVDAGENWTNLETGVTLTALELKQDIYWKDPDGNLETGYPDYASSLNLMHEAEMELRQKDIKLFYRYVEKLAIYQSGSYQINMVLAPAEVRAEAFVKTIEEAHERKEGI